jgi:hypothetical protein
VAVLLVEQHVRQTMAVADRRLRPGAGPGRTVWFVSEVRSQIDGIEAAAYLSAAPAPEG